MVVAGVQIVERDLLPYEIRGGFSQHRESSNDLQDTCGAKAASACSCLIVEDWKMAIDADQSPALHRRDPG